jgi:hypothetical protein
MPHFNFQPFSCVRGVGKAFSVVPDAARRYLKVDFGKALPPTTVDFSQDLYKHYRPQQFFATVFLSRPAVSPRLAQALAGGPPGSQLMAVAA